MANIGEHYDEWVHSPVNKKLRLFGPEVLEVLTKSPWWLIPLVWIPSIFYIVYLSMIGAETYIPTLSPAPPAGPLAVAAILPLGVLAWTFIEYTLHRFVFHLRVPHTGFLSKILIPFHFAIHGQHHKVSD